MSSAYMAFTAGTAHSGIPAASAKGSSTPAYSARSSPIHRATIVKNSARVMVLPGR